jgi:hypothetical protein
MKPVVQARRLAYLVMLMRVVISHAGELVIIASSLLRAGFSESVLFPLAADVYEETVLCSVSIEFDSRIPSCAGVSMGSSFDTGFFKYYRI